MTYSRDVERKKERPSHALQPCPSSSCLFPRPPFASHFIHLQLALGGPSLNSIQGFFLQRLEHSWGLQRGGGGGEWPLQFPLVHLFQIRQRVQPLVSPAQWRTHSGVNPVCEVFCAEMSSLTQAKSESCSVMSSSLQPHGL